MASSSKGPPMSGIETTYSSLVVIWTAGFAVVREVVVVALGARVVMVVRAGCVYPWSNGRKHKNGGKNGRCRSNHLTWNFTGFTS